MKNKILNITKKVLGEKYYYFRYKTKNITKSMEVRKDIQTYKDEEVILISVDNPNGGKSVGGKHIHLYLLMKGLSENKIKNHLITCSNNFNKAISNREVIEIFNINNNQLKKMRDVEFAFIVSGWIKELENNLIKVLSKPNNIKYINAHDVISTIAIKNVLTKMNLEIAVITTLHGYFSDENVDYGGLEKEGLLYNKLRKMEAEAYNFSDKIIAVDDRIKKYVQANSEKKDKDIEVIVNAIDDKIFNLVEDEEKKFLLEKYKYNNKEIVFVPRRLVPKNGVKYVVEAINLLNKEKLKKIKLVIAGDGVERKKIEEYINKNNLQEYIELLGDINHDEILDYFKLSKIIIVPSVRSNNVEEATSLAALEGMAVGKVTIATNIGGLKQLIIDNDNGFLVDEKQPLDIAKAIEKVFNMSSEEYNIISINARKTIIEKHGYVNHSLKFYDVFRSVLGD